jgi:hypothetical protein
MSDLKAWQLLLALSLCAAPLCAADTGGDTVGADWSRLDADARSTGLASAMTAEGGGLSSLGSNPAGLASLRRITLDAGFLSWVEGSSLQTLRVGLPWGPGALALSADSFNAGSVERVAVNPGGGNPTLQGDVNLFFLRLGLTWAQELGPTRLGLGLHVLDQNLDGNAAWGPSLDLGMSTRTPLPGFSLGAAALSLGPSLQGAALPRGWRLGAAYEAPFIPDLTLSTDYETLIDDPSSGLVDVGLELRVHANFTLRGGLKLGPSGTAQGYSAGASFRAGPVSLHYAYQQLSSLDASQGLSLDYAFEDRAGPNTAAGR